MTMTVMPIRILHTMLRVTDLERSLQFYTETLRMRLLRREDYPHGRFTLAFVGYGDEHSHTVLELTYNWDRHVYEKGSAYGHIALAVANVRETCEILQSSGVQVIRAAGPMTFNSPGHSESEIIAFIADPDGYKIELIEVRNR